MKPFSSILIVDDEPNNFDVIETFLEKENYQLYYAQNGNKAINSLERVKPDLILMDVMMPEIDGLETCRLIKQSDRWHPIPIIMVTALTSKEDLARCLTAGADDFISKPIHGMELRARINSMLRIKHQYDEVQELLQWRQDMVNMMVHDLRNSLTNMILSAHILQYPNLPPEKQQIKVHQIIMAGQELQSMIDSLLLMAKLESSNMVLNYSDVDLHSLCHSIVEQFKEIAKNKNLQLISELPKPGGGNLKVDLGIFRRIIDNLVANAIKFSPVNSKIILRANYLEDGWARIEVADFGLGIQEELREIIFNKYETGKLIKNTSQTGLGLAFCKMAIEAHGGKITLRDNHPQGSIFTVEIPEFAKVEGNTRS
ncbi:MAG: hybrid sensor histidine kinase/response regulator [Nostocales cyanobacterium]|nr:MAG: hybrid sensor histidine kinase/response regulator [Nostocales cyanobacterium]